MLKITFFKRRFYFEDDFAGVQQSLDKSINFILKTHQCSRQYHDPTKHVSPCLSSKACLTEDIIIAWTFFFHSRSTCCFANLSITPAVFLTPRLKYIKVICTGFRWRLPPPTKSVPSHDFHGLHQSEFLPCVKCMACNIRRAQFMQPTSSQFYDQHYEA